MGFAMLRAPDADAEVLGFAVEAGTAKNPLAKTGNIRRIP